MKVCTRCGTPRSEKSFYFDGSHPEDICKPCIHRPGRSGSVMPMTTREKREQAAILSVVKQTQNGRSFVYLMKAGRRIKIGFSTQVDKRLQQLSTASSRPIRLIAVVPGGQQLEKELHSRFRHLWTHVEWFEDKRHEIVRYVATLPGTMIFQLGYVSQEAPLLGVTE